MAEVVAPPAAPAAPAATPTPPPAASAAPVAPAGDWTSGFNDTQKGYVQTKGFKGPGDVLDSYVNFEKLMGAPKDRLLTLPESMESPEARAIWERLGTPKDAKGYQLDVPQGGDPKQLEWAANEFHKLGVPKGMAEGFVKAWNLRQAQGAAANAENQKAAGMQAEQNLKKEWGMAFEQNKVIVDTAARNIGMGQDEVSALSQALGPEKALRLLHKLGTATAESSFVVGRPSSDGVVAPEQARGMIEALSKDQDFIQRLSKGDTEAVRKWDNAHKMAYPGEMSI